MHYGYLAKVSSWKEFSLRALYYPGVLSLGCPAEITLGVNNVCVRSKQSYLQRLAFFICRLTLADVLKKILMPHIWLSHLERNSTKVLTFNMRPVPFCHRCRHKSLSRDEKLLIARDYYVIYLVGTKGRYRPLHLDPSQTTSIRLFVSWLIYQCLFIYILCFFWWLAWCATLCFVNGFMPRVAANDTVVIVCQCDNVWFPISMWSWTFDEGGILSGRQSAVICQWLNELLSRHPLSFQWQYHIHRSPFGLAAIISSALYEKANKKKSTLSHCCSLPHVELR